MPESSLSLKLTDLAQEVGLFLGYGRGADGGDPAWNNAQQALITGVIKSGLRQFYYPPKIDGIVYKWSFLRPTTSLYLPSAARYIDLPDDFGGIEGMITLSSASTASQAFWPVNVVGEQMVREQYARVPNAAGRPEIVAVEPLRGTTGYEGQRFRLSVYPEPEQAYNLTMTYYVQPDYLIGSRPFPLGGLQHAETILESCLAIAEERLDDRSGVHAAKFLERMRASIEADRINKPALVGYNGDRSDGERVDPRTASRWFNRIDFNF